MTNVNEVIVRVSYSKENPEEILLNDTEKGNSVLTGTIVWAASDVEVESHRRIGFLDRDDVIGLTGVLVMPNQDDALSLAVSIDEQERAKGKLGNSLPFVWVRVRLDGHEVSFRKAQFADENTRLIINDVDIDDVVSLDGEIPDEALAEELNVHSGSLRARPEGLVRSSRKNRRDRTNAKALDRFRKKKLTQTKAAEIDANNINPPNNEGVTTHATNEAGRNSLLPAVKDAAPNPNDNPNHQTEAVETSAHEIVDEARGGVGAANQSQREVELAAQVKSQAAEIAELKTMVEQLLAAQQSNNGAGALVNQ